MQYSIYKLEFQTGVHFGTGMLNESAYTFQADQLACLSWSCPCS